jgi:hypothetical protein
MMAFAGCIVLGTLLCAASVSAQANDTTASRAEAHSAQNAWISAGFGAGTNGFGEVVSGWFSGGGWVVGIRTSSASGFFSPEYHDRALILGIRARSGHLQTLLGAGPGRIGGSRSNGEQSGTRSSYADESSVGLAAEAGWTSSLIGIGLSAFGAKGPTLSFGGIALAIQLGWMR